MVTHKRKTELIILTIMIAGFANKALAFPLPTMDFQKLGSNVRIVAQQVREIKTEIESNINIVKEIQHGGFGAAVGDLFGKIQNGSYDRFGNNLQNIRNATESSWQETKYGVEAKRAADAARDAGASKDVARAAAEEKAAKLRAADREKAAKAAIEKAKNREAAKSSGVQNAYSWLKDNRVAGSVSNVSYSAQNRNWGGVVSSATQGAGRAAGSSESGKTVGKILTNSSSNVGGAVNSGLNGNWGGVTSNVGYAAGQGLNSGGASTVGNIVSRTAGNAGQVVNSSQNGDWSRTVSNAASGAASGLSAGGKTTAGSYTNAAGQFVSGSANVIQRGGNAGQMLGNAANNGSITSGVNRAFSISGQNKKSSTGNTTNNNNNNGQPAAEQTSENKGEDK